MNLVIDDTTKPSRINRKKKRRWKMSDLIKSGLTDWCMAAILIPLLPHVTVGICSPSTGHKRPQSIAVFLCPPKTQAVLCLVLSIMAGYFRQPLKRLAGSCTGTANLIYSATRCFAALNGGYPLFTGCHHVTK
ncbi:MAG: hypothetical protein WCP96_05325 [Methylococcaceae bacterium]